MAEVRAIGVAKGDVRKRRNSRGKSGFSPPPQETPGIKGGPAGGWVAIVARKSVDCSDDVVVRDGVVDDA